MTSVLISSHIHSESSSVSNGIGAAAATCFGGLAISWISNQKKKKKKTHVGLDQYLKYSYFRSAERSPHAGHMKGEALSQSHKNIFTLSAHSTNTYTQVHLQLNVSHSDLCPPHADVVQ